MMRFPTRSSPGTLGLIAALVLFYVLAWGGLRETLAPLAFRTDLIGQRPWSVVTYPLASLGMGVDVFFFLLAMLWLFFAGREIEGRMGLGGLLGVFFGFSALGALSVWVGALVAGASTSLIGTLLPLALITVVWAGWSPTAQVMLYGVVPIQMRWIAVISVVVAVFSIGAGSPLVGLFTLIPSALAWFFATGKLPLGRSKAEVVDSRGRKQKAEEFDRFQDEVAKRAKEREERERLRKLFEDSMRDDPK